MAELPREILLPRDFEGADVLAEVLGSEAGRRVEVRVPQRGEKRRLVELAGENARHVMEDRLLSLDLHESRTDASLYGLQERLDLKVVPRVIVCFDISHTQGAETVASAVVFENGDPRKGEYRHMRIKGDWGNDDFRSMEEAVHRYFGRRLREERPLPDLVLELGMVEHEVPGAQKADTGRIDLQRQRVFTVDNRFAEDP